MAADPNPITASGAQPRSHALRSASRWLYGLLAAAVFVGDQLTKRAVEHNIPLHAIVPVIPHFFNLTYTYNTGAAFGLFSQDSSSWTIGLLVLVSLVLLAAVVGIVWKSERIEFETGVALALILGGAASNLLGRVRAGRVVDFLDFYVRSYHWFTFNIADSAIVAGACLLILHFIITGERGSEK